MGAADQPRGRSDSQIAEDKKQTGQVDLPQDGRSRKKGGDQVGSSWPEMPAVDHQALDRAPEDEFPDPKSTVQRTANDLT
ncbi:MAG: hypothetical protein U0930_05785 [Pirellulales bacterium]